MRSSSACALILAALVARSAAAQPVLDPAELATLPAGAEPAPQVAGDAPPADRQVSTARRVAAVALAVVPGVVARGAGSFVAGESRTALRLAAMAAVGVSAMVVGGLPTGISGGNPYLIVPAVPILVAGTGVTLSSWFSDVWVAAGGRDHGVRATAPWAIEVGSTWLRDALRDRALARVGARIELGRVDLGLTGWLDAGGDAFEGLLGARVRILGTAASGRPIADNSRLVVRTGVRARTDAADRVSVVTGEVELIGRLDLHRLDRALAGTFTELSTGLGVQRAAYRAGASDVGSVLLGGFAWGAYLGHRGEARVFYEHRRDHLAGGLVALRAAGFLGSFGVSADVRITGPWAVRGELEIGSAWVSTLAVRYQGGPR